jgi:hypothetical protein
MILSSVPSRVRDLFGMVMLLDRMELADSVEKALDRLDELQPSGGPAEPS